MTSRASERLTGKSGVQSATEWRAVIVFYVLACAWSWPLFWWRDVHTASWNAWHIPANLKGAVLQWGPGFGAIAVFCLFPRVRSRFLSLSGSSWKRSALCFLVPVFFACVASASQPGHVYRRVYDLSVFAFSCLGEELGWRGFLQGALGSLGRVRSCLLVALMWTAWHFNSTREGLISHLEILLPVAVVVTLVLAVLMERTGSLIFAATVHEWLDLGNYPGGYLLWAAVAAVPIWLWIVWTWPRREAMPDVASHERSARITSEHC